MDREQGLRNLANDAYWLARNRAYDDADVVTVRALIEAARQRGYTVYPLAVAFVAYNQEWLERKMSFEKAFPPDQIGSLWKEEGGVIVGRGFGAPYIENCMELETASHWSRHLVAVVDERWVVNPMLEAFNQPGMLDLTDAIVTEFPSGGDASDAGIRIPLKQGGELVYKLERDYRLYEKLGVWKRPKLAIEMAGELLQRYDGFTRWMDAPHRSDGMRGFSLQ